MEKSLKVTEYKTRGYEELMEVLKGSETDPHNYIWAVYEASRRFPENSEEITKNIAYHNDPTIFFKDLFGPEIIYTLRSTADVDKFMERQLGRKLKVVSSGTNLIRKPVLRIKPYNIDREFIRALEGKGNTGLVDALDLFLDDLWYGAKDYWNQAKENIYRKAK
jgi:hypothetical protein